MRVSTCSQLSLQRVHPTVDLDLHRIAHVEHTCINYSQIVSNRTKSDNRQNIKNTRQQYIFRKTNFLSCDEPDQCWEFQFQRWCDLLTAPLPSHLNKVPRRPTYRHDMVKVVKMTDNYLSALILDQRPPTAHGKFSVVSVNAIFLHEKFRFVQL